MACPDEVFQRVEKKYRVSAAQRQAIEHAMRAAALEPDSYGRTRVTSVYLDTPDRAVIARSLEKPLYKEKLRLRAYGEEAGAALLVAAACLGGPVSSDARASASEFARLGDLAHASGLSWGAVARTPVFFELKKKFDGVVYKRRVCLSLSAACAFLGGVAYEEACRTHPLEGPELAAASLSARSCQIAREIDAVRQRWEGLRPSMAIACDRVAWAARVAQDAGDVRVAGAAGAAGAAGDVRVASAAQAGAAGAARVADAVGAAHAGASHAAGVAGAAQLRVTFDSELCCLDCTRIRPDQASLLRQLEGFLQKGSSCAAAVLPLASSLAGLWRPIIGASESIMEVKSAGALPLWLSGALASARAYPTSFSKYGTAAQLVQAEAHVRPRFPLERRS